MRKSALMAEPLLDLAQGAIARGGRLVVEDASLSLRAGEIVILRGPNGAGKSSLLLALSGLRPLAGGRLSRRAATASLTHANGLKAALTIDEHLGLWRRFYGFSAAAAETALARLSLAAMRTVRAGALSAGQARRAALLRIVVSGAPLWLLDEPTAGVDAGSARAATDLVIDHAAKGGAALIATHEPFDAPGARIVNLGAPS
jgi:heme exporter protein A